MLAVIAISSNLTVCVAFGRNEKLRSAFSLMIVSLAVADMLNGFIVIPSYCIFIFESQLYRSNIGFYCYAVYICFDIFFGIASIYNMTLMSIDRALMIAAPNFHRRTLSKREVMKRLLPIPWFLALALTVPKIIHYTHKIEGSILSIVYFVVAFILPCIIITVCYGYISNRKIVFARRQLEHTMKDLRLAYTVLAIIVIFFICWTPFFGVILYYALCTVCKRLNGAVVLVKWLQFLHSCCNPFIYALLQPRFRQEVKEIIKKCLKRGHIRRQHDESVDLEQQPISECTNV